MARPAMDGTRGCPSIHPTRGVGWWRWWGVGTLLPLLGCLALAHPVAAQRATAADSAAVHRAALDYLEGFYEGADEKLRRAVHPEVRKYGYARQGPGAAYRGSAMTFERMFEFAASVRAGRNLPPEGAPKEVILLDVQDQTAAVKVVAWWGQDYFQLARIDGRWMIVHVLWQTLDG